MHILKWSKTGSWRYCRWKEATGVKREKKLKEETGKLRQRERLATRDGDKRWREESTGQRVQENDGEKDSRRWNGQLMDCLLWADSGMSTDSHLHEQALGCKESMSQPLTALSLSYTKCCNALILSDPGNIVKVHPILTITQCTQL